MFKKLRKFSTHKWMLYGILLTGPASMLAIEFGWFLTEMGRQPWIGFVVICAWQKQQHKQAE
ncbi:cytochrome ubiquinol oxidase subunit I [Staphylococcus aureus]